MPYMPRHSMQALCSDLRDGSEPAAISFEAYHEAKNCHVWTASKEDCDLCGRGPCGCGSKHCDDCRADVKTNQCVCGMVRCSKCAHVHEWYDPAVRGEVIIASPTQDDIGDRLALPSVPVPGASVIASTPAWRAEAGLLSAGLPCCTLCGQAPRKICSCGEGRCEQCLVLSGGSPVETWFYVHPLHRPATCYITDQQRTSATQKLEWIVFELGEEADLISFAGKYRELFGENAQKAKCLDHYRKYANIAKSDERGPYPTVAEARKKFYSMECQVPPAELEEFQNLWDSDAPRRCHECNNELPIDATLWQRFCCAEHANAGEKVICNSCVTREDGARGEDAITYCGGDVVYHSGCRVCTACGQGSNVAKIVSRIHKLTGDTEVVKSRKRSAESFQIYNNVLGGFAVQQDPQYVPAWTKKQRL